MDLPLLAQHANAVCIDHVFPTMTGAHVHTEPISARDGDPRVRELAGLPGRDGHVYLSFGTEIDTALAASGGGGRGRAVLYQFLRGVPAEVADRAVVRLLEPDGLTLADVAARADQAGLPVEVPRAMVTAGGPVVDPSRLIGFDAAMRLVPVAAAETLWIAPARHWAAGAYADAGPEAVAVALRTAYPLARIVFDGAGGVHLGLPAALVAHAHGAELAALRRPLGPRDLPATAGKAIGGYGDLLAALAEPGTRAFVTVRAASGAELTVLAVHDRHGLSFLDPGTGGAAVFPEAPSAITLHPADGTASLADLHTPPVINHSSTVHAVPAGARGRTIDVVGPPGALSGLFLAELVAAAEGVDAPVVVVATEKQSAAPSTGQLLGLEWLLLQHRFGGGAPPIVVIRGDATPALSHVLGGYGVPVVHQPRTTGGGLGLNLDNLWSGRDAAGNPVAAPVRALTADLLRAVGAARPNAAGAARPNAAGAARPHTAGAALSQAAGAARPRAGMTGRPVDERLRSYLFTPLEDVAAIRSAVAAHGSALKTLMPQVSELGLVQADLFAGWEAILRIEERADPVVTEAAYESLGAGASSLAFVPAVLDRGPDVLTDLIDLTRGPVDNGARRAILGAMAKGMSGAPLEEIRREIYRHSVYLPETGRTALIRELQGLAVRRPEHSALFEQVAIYVETCP
ncbi:hypothetical protein J2S43_004700 [Catenuloplanes nepalensis]|uniref:Uncharacterized protein n=1 Tax=Catenuloplanes nepalensis TaxID=587533 RepID=A0ABT9MY67_9ACTN|nr:hypothetical protein [Catenuloplanes nepalensis]MDP9796188.1 hypothetical protein [Catenuloplanes nepalensis]